MLKIVLTNYQVRWQATRWWESIFSEELISVLFPMIVLDVIIDVIVIIAISQIPSTGPSIISNPSLELSFWDTPV